MDVPRTCGAHFVNAKRSAPSDRDRLVRAYRCSSGGLSVDDHRASANVLPACRFGAGATPVTVDAAPIPGARRLIRRCRRSGRTVGFGGTEVYNGSGGRGASFTWLLMR